MGYDRKAFTELNLFLLPFVSIPRVIFTLKVTFLLSANSFNLLCIIFLPSEYWFCLIADVLRWVKRWLFYVIFFLSHYSFFSSNEIEKFNLICSQSVLMLLILWDCNWLKLLFTSSGPTYKKSLVNIVNKIWCIWKKICTKYTNFYFLKKHASNFFLVINRTSVSSFFWKIVPFVFWLWFVYMVFKNWITVPICL